MPASFRVERMDGRRIDRIRFTPTASTTGEPETGEVTVMSDWAGIAWLVILLLVNAFFVGAEFAVISARRSQIEPRAEAGLARRRRPRCAPWSTRR